MKMNGNCAKVLLLLILFAMTFLSLESKCGLWLINNFPPFVPKSDVAAREEYCDIDEERKMLVLLISPNDLDYVLRQWARKYNVLDQYEKYYGQIMKYDMMFYKILDNKIMNANVSEEIKNALFSMSILGSNKNFTPRRLSELTIQTLCLLPEAKRLESIELWLKLTAETKKKLEFISESGNITFETLDYINNALKFYGNLTDDIIYGYCYGNDELDPQDTNYNHTTMEDSVEDE
uniref:DUF148 domain-containing protein n=1 Tax=Elaeophora elaphi TaxID=1147741 RepID=A0A0R3RP21_9BILA